MLRWPRPPNLLRLFVGQHIVNGLSVGAGVILIAIVASATFGFAAGQPATLGAISASISDLPAPWREKARTMGFGFALALLSTAATQMALPLPFAALMTIGAISFAAGMVTGLGRWAVAVAMQAVIPMVFVLGFPRETFPAAVRIETLFAAGGVAYIAFALAATVFTDASARRLVASESIREFSIYLRTVSGIFDPDQNLEEAYGAAIRQQAALAEQLQSARALLLDRTGDEGARLRLAATIGVLLDALDALVAAQCDVALIRKTPAARSLLQRIDRALRTGAADLEHLSIELLTTAHPALPPNHERAIYALKRELVRLQAGPEANPDARAAVEASTRRLVLALGHVRRLEKTLSNDTIARGAIGDVDLAAFIPRRIYSLNPLAAHFNLDSPVLRFSVRLALAMMAGALIAQSLGDERHGNWVLLTIAVVMRAGLRAHPTAPRRSRHRHARRVRAGVRSGRLFAGRRAGRGPGFGRRGDPQLRPPQLPHRFGRRLRHGAGVAAPGSAVGLRAHSGASRRHADRRGDRASLQLFLAALGILGGAAPGKRAQGPACAPSRLSR